MIQKNQDNLFRHKKFSDTMDDMTLSVVKSEQYTRRDVVTVVGLPLAEGPESQTDLSTKVGQVLSQSGEDVNQLTSRHAIGTHVTTAQSEVRQCRLQWQLN